jgi:hypothetical protein
MRKLIFIMLIFFASCEGIQDKPSERAFMVRVYPQHQCAFTIYFPLLEESATNPLEILYIDFIYSYDYYVKSTSPLRINAIAKKKNNTIFVEIYENNILLLRDSVYNSTQMPEIWLDYIW